MAKQISDTIITGTQGNLVFYKMEGKGYVRTKSRLTSKQFNTKACFANSRKSAARFKTANIMASELYRNLPINIRNHALFCSLRTTAIRLLKIGTAEQEVRSELEKLSSVTTVL